MSRNRTGEDDERLRTDPFGREHLLEGIGARTLAGGLRTVVAQAVRFLVGLGATAVLARLLAPSDFGLVAMVAPIAGLLVVLRDAGLPSATIQRARLSAAQASSLFWVNLCLGLLLAVVLAALAPLIAGFFEQPRTASLTLGFAGVLLLASTATQHRALLQRGMRFRALAWADVAAAGVGSLAGIGAALAGAGVWALVVLPLATEATAAAWVWAAARWRPGPPRLVREAFPLLRFGGFVAGFQIVNFLGRRLDDVLIGRAWGPGPLGLYSKAYRLLLAPVELVNSPLGAAVVPALSALQHDPDRYRRLYRSALEGVAAVGTPLTFFLFVEANDVVRFLLGAQWDAMVPIFRRLLPAALMATTNVAAGWVFVSAGRVRQQMAFGLAAAVVLAGAIVAGLPWGALGVATGVSASRVALKVPSLWVAYRGTPVRLSDFFAATWRPALAAGVATGIVLAADGPLAGRTAFVRLAALGTVFLASYAAVFVVLPGGFDRLARLRRVARDRTG